MIENSERSSARTGGPATRFPSVSYWPPWHGQPKPVTSTGVSRDVLRPDVLLLVLHDQPVRLHRAAEVGAARVEHRERRHVVLGSAVVADVHRPPRHLADFPGPRGTSRSRTRPRGSRRSARARPRSRRCVRERRQHGEAEHRQRDQAADGGAEAERGDGEEGAARVLLRAFVLVGRDRDVRFLAPLAARPPAPEHEPGA